MEKQHNTKRSGSANVLIMMTVFIFLTLWLPGIDRSISALGPVDGSPGESVLPLETDQDVELGSLPPHDDYLDEARLIQCIKSILAANNADDIEAVLPEAKAAAVYSAKVKGKVALSFDDGPYEGFTEKYIEVLKAREVGATFFVVGNRAEKFTEQTKKIAEEGFDIGIHSYAHGQLTKRDANWIAKDFDNAIAAVKKASGVEVKLFRPPYGDYNNTVLGVAVDKGLHTIRWNVDPRDWQEDDPKKIVDNILKYSADGSIILMHEGRQSTLDALPKIIDGLTSRGFEIVSVKDLLLAEQEAVKAEKQNTQVQPEVII